MADKPTPAAAAPDGASAPSPDAPPPLPLGETELLVDQLERDIMYVIVDSSIPLRKYLEGAHSIMLAGDKAFLDNDYGGAFKHYKKFIKLMLVDIKKHMFYDSKLNRDDIVKLQQFATSLLDRLSNEIAPKIRGRRVPKPLPAPVPVAPTPATSATDASSGALDGTAAPAKPRKPPQTTSFLAPTSSLASIYTPKPPPGSLTAASVPFGHSPVGQASSAGLRKVHLPVALLAKFKELCTANTAAGIETCALLMGREVEALTGDPNAHAAAIGGAYAAGARSPPAKAPTPTTTTTTTAAATAAASGHGGSHEEQLKRLEQEMQGMSLTNNGSNASQSSNNNGSSLNATRSSAPSSSSSSSSSGQGARASTELVVTHIVFPEQRGTPNSVETYNEECVIAVQEKHDVYVIGWIHTHPTQTCFLSSVDVHCQCSYQTMLPEAVAIVVAPKFNEVGIFHLTKGGMNVVGNCKEPSSTHHPHSAPATDGGFIYCHTAHTVLHYPRGHARHSAADIPVIMPQPGAPVTFYGVEVVDLRKGGNKAAAVEEPKTGFAGLFTGGNMPAGPKSVYGASGGLKYPAAYPQIPASLRLR